MAKIVPYGQEERRKTVGVMINIRRGYAVATMCYHDIYPDRAELRDYSVASLFPDYISGSKIMMSGKQLEFWALGIKSYC